MSGSHGLVGGALVSALTRRGHQVSRLVRGGAGPGDVTWDIGAQRIDTAALSGVDAAVHLAGASLFRRWTEEGKALIQDSRLDGTRLLARALAVLDPRPSVLVSGSAVGYYGSRGDEVLDESSAPGSDFLANLCQGWEGATAAAGEAGIRVVHLRTGIVQSANGGALARQLPIFRAGLGGRLGSGEQFVSWVSLEDEVGAIIHALDDQEVQGPLNATSPHPVTNADFTRCLAGVLGRPAVLPVPAAALSLVLGRQMATGMLLASQRVLPARLESSGYRFRHPDLAGALRAALEGR